LGASLALLLALLVAVNLPSTADEAIAPPAGNDRSKTHAESEAPRARSRPRGADAPLAHALLKKEEDTIEEKMLRALEKPTNVEWQELPLEDCLSYLAEFHGINIIIDKAATSEEGIALDQPITLRLQGVRLESVLNLVLEPIDLDWVIRDEVLRVTTLAWCEAHPEVRTFEIQPLIEAGHDPEELIASIKVCIDPSSWQGKDAFAGIAHSGGVLVVRQTQRQHSEIARLLAELEEIAEAEADHHRGGEKQAAFTVKVYLTGDQPAEKIAEALLEFVEVKSWKNRGGQGDVRPLNGSVVVNQTASVHRAVHRFLSQIDSKTQLAASTQPAAKVVPGGTATDPFRVLPAPAGNAPRPVSPLRKK
jgi:hypothetical protein